MSVTEPTGDLGPLRASPAIDATALRVAGPILAGDEHPTRKRWFFTGRFDDDGEPIWYRPPALWRRRALLIGLMACMWGCWPLTLIFLFMPEPGARWGALSAGATAIGATLQYLRYRKEPVNFAPGRRPKSWW